MIADIGTKVTPFKWFCNGGFEELYGMVAVVRRYDCASSEGIYYFLDWGDIKLNEKYGCLQADGFKKAK